tara:strand:+ start:206 stop:403 length:198 start_codon:yes stop_codon:yes gene_type:complete
MTDSQREELIYDIAQDQLKRTTASGVWAFATDRLCWLLAEEPDDVLVTLHSSINKKKSKTKGTGF